MFIVDTLNVASAWIYCREEGRGTDFQEGTIYEGFLFEYGNSILMSQQGVFCSMYGYDKRNQDLDIQISCRFLIEFFFLFFVQIRYSGERGIIFREKMIAYPLIFIYSNFNAVYRQKLQLIKKIEIFLLLQDKFIEKVRVNLSVLLSKKNFIQIDITAEPSYSIKNYTPSSEIHHEKLIFPRQISKTILLRVNFSSQAEHIPFRL